MSSTVSPAGLPGVDLSDGSPRGRLLAAMAEAVVEKGFAATTVADVVRLARTSRRTFYEHFDGREQCYIALHDVVNSQLIAYISGAVDRSCSWPEQTRQAIEAWIRGCGARPELMLSWIRDCPALPTARSVQVAAQHRFVELINALLDTPAYLEQHRLPPVGLSLLLVGGLREVIATQVEAGRPLGDVVELAVTATVALLDAAEPGPRL